MIVLQSVWDPLHADGSAKLAAVISSLKGFYVKTAQIISSRQDLFPPQYTEALSSFTDNVDPMPASLVKAIIKQELLNRNEPFDSVFSEFDDVPLGSASIAQVHRAVLTEKYGGPREVAIKCQRPSIESKLLGDIKNLISISKALRGVDALPLDYYTVFCELEKSLADEFDFVAEAVAMDRIYTTITTDSQGRPVEPPLTVPRPIPGLVSRRVLVMDYLEGVPLSR
jgi:aarF domain-containing kinase